MSYCYYCKKDDHNDSECWSTRPADWRPSYVPPIFRPKWDLDEVAKLKDALAKVFGWKGQ